MDASDAARIFHDWAETEGLMAEGAFAPLTSTLPEMANVKPVTDAGKVLLRNKQVRAIAFNEKRKEIVVFLRRSAPTGKKLLGQLPAWVADVEIRYRQGSPLPIGPEPALPFGGPAYTIRTTAAGDRYTCGSSISVGNFRDAGTMTALVRNAAGAMHGLSNNHVSGACSYAGVGLPILAPGVFDVAPGGLPPFTLGFHANTLPLVTGSPGIVDPKANSDAAVFTIRDEALVSSYQGDAYDTPTVVADLVPNLDVEKVGRTTGHTKGRVVGQAHGAFQISYSAPAYNFSGPVFLDPVFLITGTGADLFSDGGDSGSLITTVDQGQRTAVGIVVGGMVDSSAPGGKVTIALPIRPILDSLQVTLVGGHNL